MDKIKINNNSVEIKVYEEYAEDSDNKQQYRYLLTKEWGTANKVATVVMYNPSEATYLMYDKTVMNVENYLKRKNFNKIIILNLFAIKGKKSSIVVKRNEEFEKKNINYIKKYIKEANEVYLAWGYGKSNRPNYVKEKILEVERIVKNIKMNNLDSVRTFADKGKVKLKCHPQNMNIKTWTDIKYDFSHLE